MHHLLEPIFSTTLDILAWGGVWSVFFLMILESACIPAPSELIMLYAGYLVYTGEATFIGVVAAGVIGNLIGSLIAWGIGAAGGRPFLERHGKWLHMKPKHLEWADSWFARHGAATVFWTRNMPIIRTFISLPAGIARMPLPRFSLYTFVGCIPWVTMLAGIGLWMGPKWEDARDILHYGDYLMVALIVSACAYLAIRHARRRGVPSAE